MVKLVVIKVGEGSFDRGFPVTLQLGEDGTRPSLEITSNLPPTSDIPNQYRCWQSSYLRLGLPSRLEAKTGFAINVSQVEDCDLVALKFRNTFNDWLNSDSFRPIREKLLEQLKPTDEIRIILQTGNQQLQRLPWHLWDWFDRYSRAEIALSSSSYERIERYPSVVRNKVRILAIVGNSDGINTESDRALLSQLPQAETTFLVGPDRQTLTECLWQEKGWDIFFFAGHSSSHPDSMTGRIYLNRTDSLTIAQLKYALKRAVENGLKIAIFNSCDGLGLAHQLADLQIPQILVMREPVPDKIAQEFLKYFVQAFAKGTSFYLSVREAREKLQGLEHSFPCATWLPVIWQNPTEIPLDWQKLINKTIDRSNRPVWHNLGTVLLTSIAIAGLTIGLRHLGILQSLELMAFDRLIQLKPEEKPDPRLLVVTITEADIAAQNPKSRRGSLGDDALARILAKIEPLEPRAIGLDIYRDFPVESGQKGLAKRLQTSDNFIAVCKVSDRTANDLGISPPPEIPKEQIGFSDFVVDNDGRVRRHLFALTPEPTSPCQASYAFSTQLAFRFLAAEGILPKWTTEKLSKIRFVPPPVPNSSSPQGRARGGASRSDTCKVADLPLTALVPTNDKFVWGLTLKEHPTFFFYVPYSFNADLPAEFVLQDQQKNTIYQTYINLAQTPPGIVKITTPDTSAPLEINKMYRWYFLVYCNLDAPVYVEGWIKKIAPSQDLRVRLENSTPQQQSSLLADNGIWYDALSTLANLRLTNPKDISLSQDWKSLLESVGLGSIAIEPLKK